MQKERMGILVNSYKKNCSRSWRARFIKSTCGAVCCLQWEGVAAFQQWIHLPGGEFAMGELLLFTSVLWSVCLPSCLVPIRMKDGKLVLFFILECLSLWDRIWISLRKTKTIVSGSDHIHYGWNLGKSRTLMNSS